MRFFRRLHPMSDRDYPYRCFLDAVEETVRRYNDFAIGEVGELGHHPPRLWKLLKPSQGLLRPLSEARCRRRVLPADVSDGSEKLGAP